ARSGVTATAHNKGPGTPADDPATAHVYAPLPRQVEERQGLGPAPPQVPSYNFDIAAAGAVAAATSLISPDGRRVDSTFDRLDRLVARSDFGQGAPIGTYEYLGPDRVAVLTFQNHTRLTHIGQAGGHNADTGFDDDQRIV